MPGKTEKNYEAIAKRKMHRPADVKRNRNLLVYSRNKKGKTEFCASAGIENILFLDPEHGTDTMVKKNPHVFLIERWEDMQDAYGYLRTGKTPFKFVAVDGLTKINNMALRYIMKVGEEKDLDRRPGMVARQDYNKSGELMKQMLANFHNLNLGIIYTAQERMLTIGGEDDEEEETTTYFVPDLPAGVRGAVNALVDIIGRLYVVRVKMKGSEELKPQRRLYIGQHERYDTGYRSDFKLPDVVKSPTIPKLLKLMLRGEET